MCAGSAGLYLFGMDFLYDVENGIFAKGGGGAFEAVIVVLEPGLLGDHPDLVVAAPRRAPLRARRPSA